MDIFLVSHSGALPCNRIPVDRDRDRETMCGGRGADGVPVLSVGSDPIVHLFRKFFLRLKTLPRCSRMVGGDTCVMGADRLACKQGPLGPFSVPFPPPPRFR